MQKGGGKTNLTEDAMESGDGVLPVRRDKENEVLQRPFQEQVLETMQGYVKKNITTSRALKLRSIRVVLGLQQNMDTEERATQLSSCDKGVGSTWTDTSPEEGTPSGTWRRAGD